MKRLPEVVAVMVFLFWLFAVMETNIGALKQKKHYDEKGNWLPLKRMKHKPVDIPSVQLRYVSPRH